MLNQIQQNQPNQKKPKKSLAPILTLGFIAALLIAAMSFGYVKYIKNGNENANNSVACTMEAKLCSDGSAVGRVPPTCEFAPCPNENGNSNVNLNANVSVNANENLNTNTAVSEVEKWQNYQLEYDKFGKLTSFSYKYTYNQQTKIVTPFDIALYRGSVTPYGVIFFKVGEMRQATGTNIGEFSYEYGINPDFQLFNYQTQSFKSLPAFSLKLAGSQFERIYALHFSATEPKILVEIGEYDTSSSHFEPGLVESQPVKTHGVVYDVVTNQYLTGDPLTIYLDLIGQTTTLWNGMSWDSLHQIAVAAPGGEGCGAYNSLTVVYLDQERAVTVGGEGSFNFKKEICNPSNGVSPDRKWFVLDGCNNENKFDVNLFNYASFPEPILKKLSISVSNNNVCHVYVKEWNISQTYPIITFNDGTIINFNE
ncbi:MAG: hypothetical protein WC528_01665 [Patescibacteria group bacterium]